MKRLIKPNALKKGDKIACVSLSSGLAGLFFERYQRFKEFFEKAFELEVVEMPHTLDSFDDVYSSPKNRLDDLMNAFLCPEIKGILTTIGGDDTIRLLPLMQEKHFKIIRQNPKVFLGMSDTTVNHFMCLKAGVSSFYSGSSLFGYGENNGLMPCMIENTKKSLFETRAIGVFPKSSEYIIERRCFRAENHITRKRIATPKINFLGSKQKVRGRLIGGCFEVLNFINGTKLWPSLKEWENTILFIETSEDKPAPVLLTYFLRNLAVQGILSKVKGILFGIPGGEFLPSEQKEQMAFIKTYPLYEEAILTVLKEFDVKIPVVSNLNFGHTVPQFILPYGALAEINPQNETVSILESAVCSDF